MPHTRTASLDELRAMRDRGETAAPDASLSDTDMPEGFWDAATITEPPVKQPISLRVDPDILSWFKENGEGYQTRMHAVLRAYVDGMKARPQDRR